MSQKNSRIRVTFAATAVLLFSLRMADTKPTDSEENKSSEIIVDISNEEFHNKYLKYYRTPCNSSSDYYVDATATNVFGSRNFTERGEYSISFKINSSILPGCNDKGPLIKSVARIFDQNKTEKLTIYGRILKDGSELGPTLSKNLSFDGNVLKKNGKWKDLDVTDLLKWLQKNPMDHKAEISLELRLETLTGEKSLVGRNIEDVDSKRPVLHNFFEGMASKNNSYSHPSEINTDLRCSVNSMLVDTSESPDYNYYLEPRSFDAGLCRGKCLTKSAHAILQSLMNETYGTEWPNPCCAPTKLEPLKTLQLLDIDNSNNTINELEVICIDEMKVGACDCW